MKEYKYTKDWFQFWELDYFLHQPCHKLAAETHVLEIGSYEGRSTVWFIENLLQNEKSTITCIDPWIDCHKKGFDYNIKETGEENKVKIIEGYSADKLPELIFYERSYDIIYVDGNHNAPFVMMDAVMSWCLLKPGGAMVFDNYGWGLKKPKTQRPQIAIDAFEKAFQEHITLIWQGHMKAIKKKQ